jgi:L-cystine uptake protein TcyP (sodium:dicarboxylate symporter family)
MARLADNPLVRAVARIPVAVQNKLLAAFAIVVALLVTVGVLGISGSQPRATSSTSCSLTAIPLSPVLL